MKPSSYRFSYRCAPGENEWDIASFLELHRNFLEWIFSWIAYWKRSLRGYAANVLRQSRVRCEVHSPIRSALLALVLRHSGAVRSIELRCAIAHLRSGARAPSQNDGTSLTATSST